MIPSVRGKAVNVKIQRAVKLGTPQTKPKYYTSLTSVLQYYTSLTILYQSCNTTLVLQCYTSLTILHQSCNTTSVLQNYISLSILHQSLHLDNQTRKEHFLRPMFSWERSRNVQEGNQHDQHDCLNILHDKRNDQSCITNSGTQNLQHCTDSGIQIHI